MTSPDPSLHGSPSPAWSQRLAGQLQLLSEVTEQLTYRLLELEVRMGEGERSMALIREEGSDGAELPLAMESWLEETEERLGRVEELLRGPDTRAAGTGRMLQAVVRPVADAAGFDPDSDGMAHLDADDSQDDPFPEEEEQLFLDEQQIA